MKKGIFYVLVLITIIITIFILSLRKSKIQLVVYILLLIIIITSILTIYLYYSKRTLRKESFATLDDKNQKDNEELEHEKYRPSSIHENTDDGKMSKST